MTALPALLTTFALILASPASVALTTPTRVPAATAAPAKPEPTTAKPAARPAKPIASPAKPTPTPKAMVPLPDVSRMTPRERRCYGRIHQPAASVLLNRTTAPRAICVQSCEAKLIAPRREAGRIAALTLFTGRACRLPPGVREAPPTEIAKARPPVPRR